MAEGKVSVLIASKLLESGEEVYRRYPNGCVYVYRDGKYAHVETVEACEVTPIEGPAKVFRFVPSTHGRIASLYFGDSDAKVLGVKVDRVEQLLGAVPVGAFGGLDQLELPALNASSEMSIELDREVRRISVGYRCSRQRIGEFKPFSQIRDLSMDCGEWFILQ